MNFSKEPLFYSILKYCSFEISTIEEALDLGVVEIEEIMPNGENALHAAVQNSSCLPETIKFLVDQGVNINAVDDEYGTPLNLALIEPSLIYPPSGPLCLIIEALLKNGASVNVIDNYGHTPLTNSFSIEQEDKVFELLLNAGYKMGAGKWTLEQDMKHASVASSKKGFEVLLKYTLLDDSSLQIEEMISEEKYGECADYVLECKKELQEMDSKNITIKSTFDTN